MKTHVCMNSSSFFATACRPTKVPGIQKSVPPGSPWHSSTTSCSTSCFVSFYDGAYPPWGIGQDLDGIRKLKLLLKLIKLFGRNESKVTYEEFKKILANSGTNRRSHLTMWSFAQVFPHAKISVDSMTSKHITLSRDISRDYVHWLLKCCCLKNCITLTALAISQQGMQLLGMILYLSFYWRSILSLNVIKSAPMIKWECVGTHLNMPLITNLAALQCQSSRNRK